MQKRYKIGEFSALTGRSPQTLRVWDKSGQLPAHRTDANHRYYLEADTERAIAIQKSVARIGDLPGIEALQAKLDRAVQLVQEVRSELDRGSYY